MQIIDTILILVLSAVSFYFGKRVSDSYNSQLIYELQYQLRLLSAQHGTGYVAPPARQRRTISIGQQFMDRLKTNGKAIQQFSPSDISK